MTALTSPPLTARRLLLRRPAALRGLPIFPSLVLTLVILLGLIGPWIAPHDARDADLARSLTPPA